MPKIPLMIEPQKDELMLSYLNRLAKHNGIHSTNEFVGQYLFPNQKSGKIKKIISDMTQMKHFYHFMTP